MPIRCCTWVLLLCGAFFTLVSCATLVHSNSQSVRIFSTPSEAQVVIDGRVHLTTAGTVSLSRFEDHTAVIEKEGYEPLTITIERRMSKWVWANLACLIFVFQCIEADRRDGGFWAFDDDIYVTLTKRADPSVPPSP